MGIAGPGFANIVHNVISFGNLRKHVEYVDYMSSGDFESFTFVYGNLGCFLTLFRSILNEYTTGVCVLASAFFRYCVICHPSAKMWSAENLKKLSLALVPAIVLILTLCFWDMATYGRQISSHFNTKHVEDWKKFIWNCKFFIYRNNIQRPILSRDIILFFCVPASMSAFFYIKVFRALQGRKGDQKRNRSLIVAFLLNWVLWVTCWTIYYTAMSINLGYETVKKPISERTIIDTVKERLASSKEQFYLVHSQMNPVFFLIVLKPFQKKFVKVLAKAFGSNGKEHDAPKNQQNEVQDPKQKQETAQSKKGVPNIELRTICVILFVLAVSAIVSNATTCVELNTSSRQAEDDCFASKIQARFLLEKQLVNVLFFQDAFSARFEDPRLKCGVRRGSFSMENKRCYFSAKHNADENLNLTEQAELCRSQNATLAYPTSYQEAGFLFRFYLFECGSDCRKNVSFRMNRWFIRLGFQKALDRNGIDFITFDDNLVVATYESYYENFDFDNFTSNYFDHDNFDYDDGYDYEYDYIYNYDFVDDYDYYNWYSYDSFYLQYLLEKKHSMLQPFA